MPNDPEWSCVYIYGEINIDGRRRAPAAYTRPKRVYFRTIMTIALIHDIDSMLFAYLVNHKYIVDCEDLSFT